MPRKKHNIWDKRALAVVIAFAMIAFWRGTWGLLDIYLFPNNYELSLWISLGIGVIMLIFTQRLIGELLEK